MTNELEFAGVNFRILVLHRLRVVQRKERTRACASSCRIAYAGPTISRILSPKENAFPSSGGYKLHVGYAYVCSCHLALTFLSRHN